MATKIEVTRICEYCGEEFKAKTTVTRYCSHRCNQRAYKKKEREKKILLSNMETERVKSGSNASIKDKDILNVKEVASLLQCSVRSVYSQIAKGNIKAINLGERLTRIRRSDIEDLFE
ncbi:DNA-binding protein [Robertkochia marina]|uniref:DNA-binding protein n=1 Tax=Robertkochia marina TaxID=1227945 RepID=A0A4S3LYY6_9FLAO|nr:helix-turn-helix domain-containing protein [Robertkochia marina]THD66830.1 DNA-binding protein [Robertkochia marina]TRZ40898.1 DNA-binding protein [Robertkochia marina]